MAELRAEAPDFVPMWDPLESCETDIGRELLTEVETQTWEQHREDGGVWGLNAFPTNGVFCPFCTEGSRCAFHKPTESPDTVGPDDWRLWLQVPVDWPSSLRGRSYRFSSHPLKSLLHPLAALTTCLQEQDPNARMSARGRRKSVEDLLGTSHVAGREDTNSTDAGDTDSSHSAVSKASEISRRSSTRRGGNSHDALNGQTTTPSAPVDRDFWLLGQALTGRTWAAIAGLPANPVWKGVQASAKPRSSVPERKRGV